MYILYIYIYITAIFTGKQESTCVEVFFKTFFSHFKLFDNDTPTQVFSCEYYEILRTPILKNPCERLLLMPLKEARIR